MAAQPKPKIVSQVCSLCGLDWKAHGKAPTTETCISLLLAEVRSLNAQLAHRHAARPLPYPYPDWPYRGYPYYGRNTWMSSTTNPVSASYSPSLALVTLKPVAT